jgi:glycerophosphoryl diester phosphodiesterase
MPWHYPRIVAHRGGGRLAPENTLAAIRLGASLGFRGVEFDVVLSRDGVPVLIHDETLERTTNGQGRVADTDYAVLAGLDAGQGERIPRFADAALACRSLGLWANVEIKPAQGHERATGIAVARLARELWQGVPLAPLVSSFSIEALEAARTAAPELPRGLLVDDIPADWKERLANLGCVSLHCNAEKLGAHVVGEAHAAGYAVLCWTVNDPSAARRLFGWGVNCLVTDALDRIGPDFR